MSREQIKEIQRALRDAGFDPGPIDGIIGPRTNAAIKAYKTANDLSADSAISDNFLASLGLDFNTEGEPEAGEGARMSLPGDPQLWKVGNKSYIVYAVPGTEPPVWMSWLVPSEEDVQSFFGPGQDVVYDQEMTRAEYRALGALDFGNTDELANFDDDPFTSWSTTMETEAATQPWILDDDYQALVAMAVLEGRGLTDAEIQSTEWWRTHTEAQREWMKLYHGDPEEAEQQRLDNIDATRQALVDAGLQGYSEQLIEFMADQVTMGNWSTAYQNTQIDALSDPYSIYEIDSSLIEFQDQLTTTIGAEDNVRNLVNRWLGPQMGNWGDEQIGEWAGTLRNDPNGEQRLIEFLKNQRLALFPQYEDRNLSYEDIASPWRSYGRQTWGQTIDEMDPMFIEMVKNNDVTLNGQLLRREGLARGVGKVMNDASRALMRNSGMVRRPI